MNGGPGPTIVNASQCCERCQKTPPCASWNFVYGPAPGWGLGCQLFTKDGVKGPATPLANVTSGQCPPAPAAQQLRATGTPTTTTGTDDGMGSFTSVAQDWAAGTCAQIRTTIRYYERHNHFSFETHFTSGADGTAAIEPVHQFLGQSTVASEFPAFFVENASHRGWVHYGGNFLMGTEAVNRPPTGWTLNDFVGGMGEGPLIVYSTSMAELPPALALSVGNHFQSAILSRRVDGAVVAGVQGFVTSVPKNWTLNVGLAPRRGILAAVNGLGTSLQAQHQTRRLTLDDDPLDKKLGYVQDDGGYYCFTEYADRHAVNRSGFKPAHEIMSELRAYHESLNLSLGVYHIDPYWYLKYNVSNPFCTGPPDGCASATCENQTAAPYHFPTGVKSVGVDTNLFMGHCWNRPNVYGKGSGRPTPWEPNIGKGQWPWENATWGCWDVQSSVTPEASKAFWHERFEQQVNDSGIKAATMDQLDCLHNSFAGWMNRTDAVSLVQQSYDDAASFFKIPYRVDLHTPSDVMASVTGSAWVTSRANGDATPAKPPGAPPGEGDTRDSIVGSSTLLSALGVRPMMDVMW